MKKIRFLTLALILALAVGCLAGCAQTPDNTTGNQGSNSVQQPSQSQGDAGQTQSTTPTDGKVNIFDRNLPYPEGTEGLSYEKNGDSYAVTGIGTATDTDVVIPAEYQGLPVTAVADEALFANETITSVTIPGSITSLGRAAFFNSHKLNAVYIWDLTAWCNIQFSSQGNPLDEAPNLYYQDTLITHLIIPDTVSVIADNAFNWCQSLESVTMGSNVTAIGVEAFKDCHNLKSVTIGNNVQVIGNNAFACCESLTSLSIPASVKKLGSFYMNDSISQIHITDVAAWCGIQFGGAVSGALYLNGEKLTELVIPDTVQAIADYAFRGQTGITTVKIPASVTKIGLFAFFRHEITTIYYDGTLAQWDALEKGRDWDYAEHDYTLICTDGQRTVTPEANN